MANNNGGSPPPPKDPEPPKISSSVAVISDAVKSVSDAFTSTFISAGQAVSGTANNIASSATSIVGSVGGAVTSAVSTVAGAVTSLTASLGPVGSIIGGIASAASAVTGAVVGIATGITSSVLAVGTAVFNVAATIATTVVSVVGSVINTCASLVSSLAGLFTGVSSALGALGMVAGAVAGVFAGVASAIGSVIGALASVVSGIVSAVTSVVGALTSAFQSVSQSLGALAGIAGEALGGFISAVQSSVESLISFAQNVSSIHDNTGMDLGQASGLTTDLQALGIASKDTARMFSSMSMGQGVFNARSSATGLARMDSPNFPADLARSFQALVKQIGYGAAKSRLDAQFGGQAPASILHMVNTDPAKLQANLNYGRQIQGQLGVGPGEIKAASEDLPLLMSRISTFVEAVKTRFAADLLPTLEAAFGTISDFMKDNAGTISNILKDATKAIFVDGPGLAANAALTVLDWASKLSDAFFGVVDAGLAVLETFGSKSGVIYNMIMTFAKAIDVTMTIINGLRGKGGHGQSTMARDAVNGLADKAHNVDVKGLRATADTKHKEFESHINATKTIVKDNQAKFGTTEQREKDFETRRSSMENMAKSLDKANELHEQHLNISKEQLGVTKGAQGGGSGGQIVARMGAYLAQDAYRLTSR